MNKWAKCVFVFFTMLAISHGGYCALKTDGVLDYVQIPNTSTVNLISITYTAWVNVSTFPAAYGGIIERKASGSLFQQLLLKNNGKLACFIDTPNLNYDGTGSFTLIKNTWYFLAMTYSNAGGLNGYVNGVLDNHVNGGADLGVVPADFLIAADTSVAGRFFNGFMDDPRIYSRALSISELQNLYSSRERYQNTDGILTYPPLNDGPVNTTAPAGTTILDRSGNGRNGVTVGNPIWSASNWINYP